MVGGIRREQQDSPAGSDNRSGSGHGADFIQVGCKESSGGCTSEDGAEKVNRYQVLFRGMQRAAAILFIPLVISWSILYWSRDGQEIQMMEVRTNPGMTTSVELPDGTEVVLNSSSLLRYPSQFADDKREVKLVGEAFFSVAKDEKKFIVGTLNKSKIVVHGTKFNIEAYKESKKVQTTLVSGKVSFSYVNNGGRNDVMMQPGQR